MEKGRMQLQIEIQQTRYVRKRVKSKTRVDELITGYSTIMLSDVYPNRKKRRYGKRKSI